MFWNWIGPIEGDKSFFSKDLVELRRQRQMREEAERDRAAKLCGRWASEGFCSEHLIVHDSNQTHTFQDKYMIGFTFACANIILMYSLLWNWGFVRFCHHRSSWQVGNWKVKPCKALYIEPRLRELIRSMGGKAPSQVFRNKKTNLECHRFHLYVQLWETFMKRFLQMLLQNCQPFLAAESATAANIFQAALTNAQSVGHRLALNNQCIGSFRQLWQFAPLPSNHALSQVIRRVISRQSLNCCCHGIQKEGQLCQQSGLCKWQSIFWSRTFSMCLWLEFYF